MSVKSVLRCEEDEGKVRGDVLRGIRGVEKGKGRCRGC